MAPENRRSVRQAASQNRSRYAEPDSDEDFEAVHVASSSNRSTLGRPAKRQKRSGVSSRPSQYIDPNTDDEFEVSEQPATRPTATKVARRKKKESARRQTRSRTKGKIALSIGRPRKANGQAAKENNSKTFNGPSDHKVPDWKSLPVEILKDIFVFGASCENKHLRSTEASSQVAWLLQAARTCRAFTLPALEAFYQSPVLLNTLQPHELLDLLRRRNEGRLLNYNVKIKDLFIDAEILSHVAPNRPLFDLSTLVAELPLLQNFEVLTRKYLPPYRMERPQRCALPVAALVQSMNEHGINLKSWRWCREFVAKDEPNELYSIMTLAHTSKAFTRLEKLTVCGYNFDGSFGPTETRDVEGGNDTERPPLLAAVIAKLVDLKDLTFNSCDIVEGNFLLHLPTTLRRLELTNCLEITSDMIRDYCKVSGYQLREMILDHNPALNLSFLTSLKDLCANLEVIKMDMTYYSERLVTSDADPLYDHLLQDNEVPSWPAKLRHLELRHAQRLSAEAAQNLFRSLIDNASQMNDMRHLTILAHINIPWRDRVGFRDQWIQRLHRVFLRPRSDPCPYLGSLRQHRLWKQAQTGSSLPIKNTSRRTLKSPQVQVPRVRSSDDYETIEAVLSRGNAAESQPRRSRRMADNHGSTISKSENSTTMSDDTESENDESDGESGQAKLFVQGLCDIVDISIDNQRPREMIWTERDFLDSEKSGDEDWNEDAEDGENDGYAW